MAVTKKRMLNTYHPRGMELITDNKSRRDIAICKMNAIAHLDEIGRQIAGLRDDLGLITVGSGSLGIPWIR